jgi:RNA recognition motif-containing protein
MRGQAHIVFKDSLGSTSALRNLQNFPFYEKNIRVAYGKSVSRATMINDGTYFPMLNPGLKEEDGDEDVKMMIDAAEVASRKRTREDGGEEEESDDDMEVEARPAKKAALDSDGEAGGKGMG